jgi:hypothetical protein
LEAEVMTLQARIVGEDLGRCAKERGAAQGTISSIAVE